MKIGTPFGEALLITRADIDRVIDLDALLQIQENAFRLTEAGDAFIPMPSHLGFDAVRGECHIKSGFFNSSDSFCIKVATSFFQNSLKGLPTGNGLMLLLSQKTGALQAVILDDGYLTDLRTALAGVICTKHLYGAPKHIGVFGTGMQAKLQIRLHHFFYSIERVHVWGRRPQGLDELKRSLKDLKIEVIITQDPVEVLDHNRLIITTTPSTTPLFEAKAVRDGTHVTAVGADGGGKQELEAALFKRAHAVYVDKAEQCLRFGDTSHAVKLDMIEEHNLIPLGRALQEKQVRSPGAITIADLTGVASQDIAIAEWIESKVRA
jgi:ornithine cyclodeaminase